MSRRCHCTATLLPDGECPHAKEGCEPRLAKPHARALAINARGAERDRRAGAPIGTNAGVRRRRRA